MDKCKNCGHRLIVSIHGDVLHFYGKAYDICNYKYPKYCGCKKAEKGELI